MSFHYNTSEIQAHIDKVVNTIEVTKNEPVLHNGTIIIKDKNGAESDKEKTTAICRCGAALNKPYCDGSHQKINFTDE